MLDDADRSPIAAYNVGGYYDGVLSGWLRTRGAYYYFDVVDEDHYHRIYNVYWVPKKDRIPYLVRTRQFRHMVGTHQIRRPGMARTWFTGSAQDESFKAFYKLPPLAKIENKLHVGMTDLRKEVVWLYELEDYDRNWKYRA